MLLYKDFEILFSNPVIMEQLNKANSKGGTTEVGPFLCFGRTKNNFWEFPFSWTSEVQENGNGNEIVRNMDINSNNG